MNMRLVVAILLSAELVACGGGSGSGTNAPVTLTGPDPLFGDQWHLKNTGQVGANGASGVPGQDINVEPAWTSTKGEGVRIAIVDDGLEIAHEDLAANIVAGQSHNYLTGNNDPTEAPTDTSTGNGHGTMCAGIAAARDLNAVGGAGVAPRASLLGFNYLQNSTSLNMIDALGRNVDVSSNSWGAADGTGELSPLRSNAWQSTIDTGLTSGRSGKGILYMWAAGNGRAGSNACGFCSDNSNYDAQANYRGVMAVAAVNDQGKQSSYSESGANLWVASPGGEWCTSNSTGSWHAITTVDRTGNVGENTATTAGVSDYANQNYTRCMNGTSAATPGAAGVVALMLAAKPNLGWRDVRIILAQTARQNDFGTCTSGTIPCTSTSTGWFLNGTGTSSATNPRYWFNHKYGFGVVDAGAAVAAAKTWTNVVAAVTPYSVASSPTLNAPIADSITAGISGAPTSSTLNVTSSPTISSIEWVEITFTATAQGPDATSFYSGDFDVTLTSPAGTVSQLAVPHNCAGTNGACTKNYNGWVFGSAAHLGEAANGNWTLTVRDGIALGGNGTLNSWQLKFYGH